MFELEQCLQFQWSKLNGAMSNKGQTNGIYCWIYIKMSDKKDRDTQLRFNLLDISAMFNK